MRSASSVRVRDGPAPGAEEGVASEGARCAGHDGDHAEVGLGATVEGKARDVLEGLESAEEQVAVADLDVAGDRPTSGASKCGRTARTKSGSRTVSASSRTTTSPTTSGRQAFSAPALPTDPQLADVPVRCGMPRGRGLGDRDRVVGAAVLGDDYLHDRAAQAGHARPWWPRWSWLSLCAGISTVTVCPKVPGPGPAPNLRARRRWRTASGNDTRRRNRDSSPITRSAHDVTSCAETHSLNVAMDDEVADRLRPRMVSALR